MQEASQYQGEAELGARRYAVGDGARLSTVPTESQCNVGCTLSASRTVSVFFFFFAPVETPGSRKDVRDPTPSWSRRVLFLFKSSGTA